MFIIFFLFFLFLTCYIYIPNSYSLKFWLVFVFAMHLLFPPSGITLLKVHTFLNNWIFVSSFTANGDAQGLVEIDVENSWCGSQDLGFFQYSCSLEEMTVNHFSLTMVCRLEKNHYSRTISNQNSWVDFLGIYMWILKSFLRNVPPVQQIPPLHLVPMKMCGTSKH